VIAAAVVILLVAALAGTYAWTQSQFFVGRAGADVAIYRGVNTEFGPLKFFTVYKVTDLTVAELNSSVRGQVEEGITARNQADAESIVRNLREQKAAPTSAAPCATPTPTPTPTVASTTAGAQVTSTPPPTPRSSAAPEPCPSPS
jgi:protein phosphatase